MDPFNTVQPEVKALVDAAVPDVIEATLTERLQAALEREYGPLPTRRARTGDDIRMACRFCRGTGCLHCDTLAHQEYERQFPKDHPLQPVVSFRLDDPDDVQLMHQTLGSAALESLPADPAHALEALIARCQEAVQMQLHLAAAPREES